MYKESNGCERLHSPIFEEHQVLYTNIVWAWPASQNKRESGEVSTLEQLYGVDLN